MRGVNLWNFILVGRRSLYEISLYRKSTDENREINGGSSECKSTSDKCATLCHLTRASYNWKPRNVFAYGVLLIYDLSLWCPVLSGSIFAAVIMKPSFLSYIHAHAHTRKPMHIHTQTHTHIYRHTHERAETHTHLTQGGGWRGKKKE